MAIYCIGDLHGHLPALHNLLKKIEYQPHHDHLWFLGDLVNRGPDSIGVLRLLKKLPNIKIVLGNHDLHLLSCYYGAVNYQTGCLAEVLAAPDGAELMEWLRQQPLLHYDQSSQWLMVHAGIHPTWSLPQSLAYANEITEHLQQPDPGSFLQQLYGDQPAQWQDNLIGAARSRFISNVLTRMRFCLPDGSLIFDQVGNPRTAPAGYLPWFQLPSRRPPSLKLLFGHWAALEGQTGLSSIFALDTGCAWGNCLTALRLNDQQYFSTPCELDLAKQADQPNFSDWFLENHS